MDLDRLLSDPTFDLPVPPGALAGVDARARRLRRRRQLLTATPAVTAVLLAGVLTTTSLPGGPGSLDVAEGPSPDPVVTDEDPVAPVAGDAPEGTRERFIELARSLRVIDRGRQRLTSQCMQAKGLPYVEPTSEPTEFDELSLPQRYGITTEQAASRGYGIAERIASVESFVDPNAAYLAGLSEVERTSWQEALGGGQLMEHSFDSPFRRGFSIAVGGCTGDAVLDLWGGLEEYGSATLVLNTPGEVVGRARRDPQAAVLDAAWAGCMTAAGQPGLSSPEEAQEAVSSQSVTDPSAGRARELEVAEADARCQESVGYGAARTALEDRYLAGLVEQYPEVVSFVERSVRTAERQASAVLQEA